MPGAIVQLVLFLAVTGLGVYAFARAVIHRYMYVKLGQPVDWDGRAKRNLRDFAVQVFGQTKLLKDRKSGLMHIVIFMGSLFCKSVRWILSIKDCPAARFRFRAMRHSCCCRK